MSRSKNGDSYVEWTWKDANGKIHTWQEQTNIVPFSSYYFVFFYAFSCLIWRCKNGECCSRQLQNALLVFTTGLLVLLLSQLSWHSHSYTSYTTSFMYYYFSVWCAKFAMEYDIIFVVTCVLFMIVFSFLSSLFVLFTKYSFSLTWLFVLGSL